MSSLIIDPYDSLLINWIINWGISHPLNLNANIFYPFANTLAYSDFHLISVLTAAPFVIFFKEPLLAFNINFLLGFILTGFSMYLLVKYLTGDYKIALLAGVILAFGTIHLNYYHHLQLFGFWPYVLTLYFFYKKNWTFFICLFVLAVATMPLFMFFLLAFFVIHRKNLKYVLLATALSLLVFIPYFLVSREFNYVRPLSDTVHFSLKIHDFIKPNNASRLFIFSGLGTLIVLFMFLVKKKTVNSFLILAIVSFILAFGPAFHLFEDSARIGPLPGIPLPYLFFYYLVPGFSGFRTPSRWILLAFFAFIIAFSLTFKNKLGGKIIALLVLLIVLEVNFPFTYTNIPTSQNIPAEQKWLANNYKTAPLIQFPIYNWSDGQKIGIETLRMHYSITHNHPMYNGYSGFSPKSWEKNVSWLQKEFPSKETIKHLHSSGIKLVLAPRSWRGKMLEFEELNLIKSFSENDIYSLNDNSN